MESFLWLLLGYVIGSGWLPGVKQMTAAQIKNWWGRL